MNIFPFVHKSISDSIEKKNLLSEIFLKFV